MAREVAGSTPADRPKFGSVAHLGERPPCKREVAGSSPAGSTKVPGAAKRFEEGGSCNFLWPNCR